MYTNHRTNALVPNKGSVIISGKASGEMHTFTNVIVEKAGMFEGSIQAEVLYVYGRIAGKVVADHLEIFHRGEVKCSYLCAKNIRVHAGGILREDFEIPSPEAQYIVHEANKPEPIKLRLVHDKHEGKNNKLATAAFSKVNEHYGEHIPKGPEFYNSF